jgi:hypothetical protein
VETHALEACEIMSLRRIALLALWVLVFCNVAIQAENRVAKKRVQPTYPELARKMHVAGSVKSCDDLASLALDLRSVVSQFKVNSFDATAPGLPPLFSSRTEAASRENPGSNLRLFSASAGR